MLYLMMIKLKKNFEHKKYLEEKPKRKGFLERLAKAVFND